MRFFPTAQARRIWPGHFPLILLLCLMGCSHEGPVQLENADIVQFAYIPPTSGAGVGMTNNGGSLGVAVVGTSTDAIWAVVVKCEKHQRIFSIRGKENYEKCAGKKTVVIKYVEIINNDGNVVGYRTISVAGEQP